MIDGYFDGSVGNSGNINENSGSNSDNFNPEYRMNFNVEGYASNESNGSSGHHHVKNRLNIMGHNKTMDFR